MKIERNYIAFNPISSDETVAAQMFHHKAADGGVDMFETKVQIDFANDREWG